MSIDDVRKRIAELPTVMSLDDEARLLEELRSQPAADVSSEWDAFNAAVTDLADSHTDAYFDITDENKEPFMRFAEWLEKLAEAEAQPRATWLRQLAKHFRMDPRDFVFD